MESRRRGGVAGYDLTLPLGVVRVRRPWAGSAHRVRDRVLHHAVTDNIRGNSDRLEDKLQAGLVQAATEAVS